MPAFTALVKVQVIRSVKLVQAVLRVLGCMAMHHIQEHRYTHAMSRVDELFQLFWCAKSTASREEAVDLVAKASIVGMLHDRHQLNDIVSKVFYPL